MTDSTLKDFINFLGSGSPPSEHSPKGRSNSGGKDTDFLTFAEFRDFLMLLPRKASVAEIYKFYQVKKRFHDGRGAARVNMDGELNVSFPRIPTTGAGGTKKPKAEGDDEDEKSSLVDGHEAGEVAHTHAIAIAQGENREDEEDEEEDEGMMSGKYVAWKFLLAGGIAGAVSRTATAPFDRLKVYLITDIPDAPPSKPTNGLGDAKTIKNVAHHPLRFGQKGYEHLRQAVIHIYRDGGGVRAFWVGNGLNVTKIFPESAIKFFSYEYSKRFFAKYWDCVPDQTEISGTSRFISGGIGGLTSQWIIYPVETLKTQLQSSIGPVQGQSMLMKTARHMWRTGGMRSYYRGLTLGLIGVFPYSAIDMSTFEAL